MLAPILKESNPGDGLKESYRRATTAGRSLPSVDFATDGNQERPRQVTWVGADGQRGKSHWEEPLPEGEVRVYGIRRRPVPTPQPLDESPTASVSSVSLESTVSNEDEMARRPSAKTH